MIYINRPLRRVLLSARVAGLSTSKNVPASPAFEITDKRHYKSLLNVYGMKVENHVVTTQRLRLPEEEYQFYQKVAPNYMVALIKKVLQDAEVSPDLENIPLADSFYHVCSYCHIKYMDNNEIELKKLHKVKTEDIRRI